MQQLKNIFIIILSTILGGVASYLYHPVMNHYLTVGDFARFESLAGMFTILATITAGFGLYLTRTFSHVKDSNIGLYRGSQRLFVLLGCGIYIIYLSSVWWIDSLLSIGSPSMVALIGLIIPISFAGIAPGSWIQGKQQFGFLSVYSIMASFGKLIFGWIFVMIGFGVFGAIGGFLFSALFATFFIIFWTQRGLDGELPMSNHAVTRFFWKGRVELIHFFLLAFLLALLQNLDLILVNRFFPGDIAGKYALVSVIMKFIIFIALSVETVYYPRLARHDFHKKDLLIAIGLLTLGSLIGYILLQLIGVSVLSRVNMVFIEYKYLMSYFYFFCILFVWVSFFMKIAIAHRLYLVNIWALIVSIGLFWYLETVQGITPEHYIFSFITALGLILIVTIFLSLYTAFFSPFRIPVKSR